MLELQIGRAKNIALMAFCLCSKSGKHYLKNMEFYIPRRIFCNNHENEYMYEFIWLLYFYSTKATNQR